VLLVERGIVLAGSGLGTAVDEEVDPVILSDRCLGEQCRPSRDKLEAIRPDEFVRVYSSRAMRSSR
jgi:hypothetical protein